MSCFNLDEASIPRVVSDSFLCRVITLGVVDGWMPEDAESEPPWGFAYNIDHNEFYCIEETDLMTRTDAEHLLFRQRREALKTWNGRWFVIQLSYRPLNT